MTTESTLPSLCVWLPHRLTRLGLLWGQEEETFFFFFHFWPCHMVSSILGSSTRDLKPGLLIVTGWSPNHWTKEVP